MLGRGENRACCWGGEKILMLGEKIRRSAVRGRDRT